MKQTVRLLASAWVALMMSPLAAQVQMPNPREISGRPLEVSDVPVGTLSVRVIRGSFDKNIPDQPVEFTVDGKARTVRTDANGRAQVAGLSQGARVRAVAVVDGERLESQETVIGRVGIRILLAATDPEASARLAEDLKLAAVPAVPGIVVLGPQSHIIIQVGDDGLEVFYVLEILNTARTPVDIGGPLTFELPGGARGTTILEGSSKQATANGPRVIVTGPFAPGSTVVQLAYELPQRGGVASVSQTWPAALQQVSVLAQRMGAMQVESPQIAAKRDVDRDGQALILATGPGLAAGQTLTLELSGLPHHPVWPRYLALSLAAGIMLLGIGAAIRTRRPEQG